MYFILAGPLALSVVESVGGCASRAVVEPLCCSGGENTPATRVLPRVQ